MIEIAAAVGLGLAIVAFGCALYGLDRIRAHETILEKHADWIARLDKETPPWHPKCRIESPLRVVGNEPVVKREVKFGPWQWKCQNPECDWCGPYPGAEGGGGILPVDAKCPKCGAGMY